MGLFERLWPDARGRAGEGKRGDDVAEKEAMQLIDEGNACEEEGRIADARQRYEGAIRLAPHLARAHLNLGNIRMLMDDLEGATDAYTGALALNPDYAAAHYNLGHAYARTGRGEAAVAAYHKALALKPDFADAAVALGCVLEDLGQLDAAVASYRRALEMNRDYAEAHYNLANVLKGLGQFDDAKASYRRVLEIKPDFADAHYNLGVVLQHLGQLDDAQRSYRRTLEIKPDFAAACGNLGNVQWTLGKPDEAAASYRRVLRINPDDDKAHANLGVVLQDLGRLDDAVASYRRALDIQPDHSDACSGLLFCLGHRDEIGSDALFAEHCRFGEQFETPLRPSWPEHGNTRDPTRCLQIGFVSADLRSHPVASFVEPLLARLAMRSPLSLHAYYNHTVEDVATKRLRGYFSQWHAIAHLSDAALAQKIADDGIDILIDLSGHTGSNRLLCFARKPAPVQASWIGYPGTTGLRAMDYYLADRYFLPPGVFDSQFTEKLVYLPANVPFLPDETAPPVNALPALSNGFVTFGSFNRISKLSRSAIALWSRLLRALPDARMLLGGMPPEGGYDSLIGWFVQEGIARERLRFYSRCSTADYLTLHHQVDMCLDTFPYTGGTTTNHALWMGVPTLTLAGRTVPGRQGAALLGQVGLEAFVATDAADFQDKGLHWAGDLAALADVRAGLRARIEQSPIRHPDVIAAGLERAFRIMWQHWCARQAPESMDVSTSREPSVAA
jgi:protein O-GlcNAc transferase